MPGVIKISPAVFQDDRDAHAVAWDEALRLFMEDTGFEPEFEVTAEQMDFFKGTAYAEGEGTSAEKGGNVLDPASWGPASKIGIRPETPAERSRASVVDAGLAREAALKANWDAAGAAAARTLAGYVPRRIIDTSGEMGAAMARTLADLAPTKDVHETLMKASVDAKKNARAIGDALSSRVDRAIPKNRFSDSADMVADTAIGMVAPWAVDLATSVPQAAGVAGQAGEDEDVAAVSQLTGTVIGRGRAGGLVQDLVPALSSRVVRKIPRVGRLADAVVQAAAKRYGETIEGVISEPTEKQVAELLRRSKEKRHQRNDRPGGTSK